MISPVFFKETGKKYPGIDYAFMGTTAYHPRWFMHYQHMNIPEAVKGFNSMIQFLLNCPTSALEKIFNPQNILYIPPVKNCFRLEFEQIP